VVRPPLLCRAPDFWALLGPHLLPSMASSQVSAGSRVTEAIDLSFAEALLGLGALPIISFPLLRLLAFADRSGASSPGGILGLTLRGPSGSSSVPRGAAGGCCSPVCAGAGGCSPSALATKHPLLPKGLESPFHPRCGQQDPVLLVAQGREGAATLMARPRGQATATRLLRSPLGGGFRWAEPFQDALLPLLVHPPVEPGFGRGRTGASPPSCSSDAPGSPWPCPSRTCRGAEKPFSFLTASAICASIPTLACSSPFCGHFTVTVACCVGNTRPKGGSDTLCAQGKVLWRSFCLQRAFDVSPASWPLGVRITPLLLGGGPLETSMAH
jgi:hypothetical protein